MEGDTSGIFALFGPGVIYSHNTIQNFINYFVRVDFNKCKNAIPFINQASKQKQNSDIDQLSDLDESRTFLLQKFEKFLAPLRFSRVPLKIIKEDPTITDLSEKIAEIFLFPSLELMSNSSAQCAEDSIRAFSHFFKNNKWNGENDMPNVSRKVILLLSSIFTKSKQLGISSESTKELVELWISFFESHGAIEDLLIFTMSWIERGESIQNVNIENVISSIKRSIIYPTVSSSSILTNNDSNNPINQNVSSNYLFNNNNSQNLNNAQTNEQSSPSNINLSPVQIPTFQNLSTNNLSDNNPIANSNDNANSSGVNSSQSIFNNANSSVTGYSFGFPCGKCVTPECVQFYIGKLIDPKSPHSSNSQEPVQRKAAALYGFLFVADPHFGLAKFGTGNNGTVFSSLELLESSYSGKVPQSLAISNDKVLFRYFCSSGNGSESEQTTALSSIEVLDITTFEKVGFILNDGTFSKDDIETNSSDNSNGKRIPEGPFTAMFDKVYFVENSTLYIYEFINETNSLVFLNSVSLVSNDNIDFKSVESSVSLVTNGHFLSIFYPQKVFERCFVSVREFNIENGFLAIDRQVPILLSSCICFDHISHSLYDLPDYEVPMLYRCQPNILSYHDFPFPKEFSGIAPLDILNALPSLLSSRLSTQVYSLKLKYNMSSPKYLYKTLKLVFNSGNYSDFVPPLVKLLYLYLFQFRDAKLPSMKLIQQIIESANLGRKDKILFIRSLFLSSNYPMSNLEHIHSILNLVEPSLLIEATHLFKIFQLNHLKSILNSEDNKFIKYAVENYNHQSYSFIQALIISITTYSFRDKSIPPSYILPIFHSLKPVHSHLFLSSMATMLPILQKALSDPLSFASSLPTVELFLKEMHSMIPPNALKDYVLYQSSLTSEQPFEVVTVIDETPHPYNNNMDYVHHYDFPLAIEISVTFDPQTNSETNCDYLQIFTDRDCNKKLTDKLSGRYIRWANNKIVTNSKHLAFKFHSDGSVYEWGYKATISAKLFSRNTFNSPNPAYDVFRTFFDILLRMMKICDASTVYIPNNCISFDDYHPSNIADISEYLKNILSKCGIKPHDVNEEIKLHEKNENSEQKENKEIEKNENSEQKENEDLQKMKKQHQRKIYELNCALLVKFVNNKFETKIQERYQFTSNQLYVINYLLDSNFDISKNNNDNQQIQEFIQKAIESPFSFISFNSQSLSDHFSNLANLMLFYIPQGISDSELDFLYKSLKGTKAAEKFVKDSLAFAEDSFKSDNLTLPSVSYAANKASLAFQLLQTPNFSVFRDHWFDCLRAMSKVKIKPISPLTSTLLDSILEFGCMFNNAFDDVNDFINKHLELLNETEINEPTVDIPIVILVLKRILSIKVKNINNNIMVSLVLRSLQFCLPYIIPYLNEIIDYFDVCLDSYLNENSHETFLDILQKIGEGYKTIAKMTGPDSICFDYGVSFSCLKAECIRKMVSNASIFTDIIINGTKEIKLACLLILSCRCYQLRPSHLVVLNDLDIEAVVSSIDPFRYLLKLNENDELSIPAYDFSKICPIGPQFTRIMPKEFQSCSFELAQAVISELDGSNKVVALNALNELLPYANIDFISLFNKLSTPINSLTGSSSNSDFVKYDEMIEMLPSDQVAYICKKNLSVYKFSMNLINGQFGFCDKGFSSPSSAILFNCNEKCVSFGNCIISENETIYSIIIGYLTDGMRVYLIINRQLKLTDIYLPPSISLYPIVITNSKSEVFFDSSPEICVPVFNNQLTTVGYSPTHIFFNDRIISIKSICSPIQCKYGDPISFDLFPSISSKLSYYFIEFALSPDVTSVSLRSPIHRAFSFYKYETLPTSPNDTFGLFINFKENYCFVTFNEEIQPNSLATIPKSDWVITFQSKTLETVFINIGQLPFMFDVDSFIDFLNNKNYSSILEFNGIQNDLPLEINKSVSLKTEINSISSMQKPFISVETNNLNLFTNNQPKFTKSTFIRPCLINTIDKGGSFYRKIGYGRFNDSSSSSSSIDLVVYSDDLFTISNIKSLPLASAVSLIDEISSTSDEFQQIFQHFVNTIPITFCLNLSPFVFDKSALEENLISAELNFDSLNGKSDFFFNNRKKQYFDAMSRTMKYNILSICLLKIFTQNGLKSSLEMLNMGTISSEKSFVNFIIELITGVDCDDFEPYLNLDKISHKPILDIIFDNAEENHQLFDTLCQYSLKPFDTKVSDFADTSIYPLNVISNSNLVMNRITLNNSEGILIIPVDTKFIKKPHKFHDNYGNVFVLSKNSTSFISSPLEKEKSSVVYSYNSCGCAYPAPIFIMKGDTILFDGFDNDELILVNVIPINFSAPQTENLNFRFSIQFISQLIEYVKLHQNNQVIIDKAFDLILKPLWCLYMSNNERLFPTLQAKWFSLLFEEFFISERMKTELQNCTNFDILIKDQPNILTGIVCLLTLFVRYDINNEDLPQDRIAHILEFALSSPINTYAVQVFRQFSVEIQNPFRITLPFPSCRIPFKPLVTSLAFKALCISKLPPQTRIVTQNEKNELPNAIVCNFEGATSIAFVKITPLTKITLTVNKNEIKPNCVIPGNSISIKITRSASESSKKCAFMLVPIYPQPKPNSHDVNTLHHYYQKLRDNWTDSDESLARCILKRTLINGSSYSFALYPDEIYQILFPNIEPDVVRYRLSLLYLAYEKLDENQLPIFGPMTIDQSGGSAFGGESGLMIDSDLSSILVPKRIVPEAALSPINVNLPLKGAKFSHFFSQLAPIIDMAPLGSLTTLGNLVLPPGEVESRAVDVVLSKLANDMFKNGLPVIDQNSSEKFKAYQAFGCLMASLANSGTFAIPVILRQEVIMYAFGNKSAFDSLDSNDEISFEDIKMQLMAMRSGVLKIELTSPAIRRFAFPVNAQALQLLPMSPIQFSDKNASEIVKFFAEEMFLSPFLRRLMVNDFVVDRILPPVIEFTDSMSIVFDKEKNTLTLPCTELWIKSFVRRVEKQKE